MTKLIFNPFNAEFEVKQGFGANGGLGVNFPFFMSKSGTAPVGTFLRIGESVSSQTGMIIVGRNIIQKMIISNGVNVVSDTTIQIQRRTNVNTFTDIPGAEIIIQNGNYKAISSIIDIELNSDEEINAYIKSGSTLENPILGVYIIPV